MVLTRVVFTGGGNESNHVLRQSVADDAVENGAQFFGVDGGVLGGPSAGHLAERLELMHAEIIPRELKAVDAVFVIGGDGINRNPEVKRLVSDVLGDGGRGAD